MNLHKVTICILAASYATLVCAESDFSYYRLGQYTKAVQPLIAQSASSALADYYLGRLSLYGYAQLKNNTAAVQYFDNAAKKGYLPAKLLMGRYALYHNDADKAFLYFKQAAAMGDLSAQMYVASAYLFGLGVKKNPDIARSFFIAAARSGDPVAQFALVEHFLDSNHGSDKKLGVIWLNKAVAAGNPRAMVTLGTLYEAGKLVQRDMAVAKDLYYRAAQLGNRRARVHLAMLQAGHGQIPEAVKLLQPLGLQGYKLANIRLAQLYLLDTNPQKDYNQAFAWMLKAARAGSIIGMREIAGFYEKGIGVAKDDGLASQWRKAADQAQVQQDKRSPVMLAALWLSNGVTTRMDQTIYHLGGIWTAWTNPKALEQNTYNQPPSITILDRKTIFQPQFVYAMPNTVPISVYYDALLTTRADSQAKSNYPHYPLNQEVVESLKSMHDSGAVDYSVLGSTSNWLYNFGNLSHKKTGYANIVHRLFERAILGDPEAQFDLAQLLEYGVGTTKNVEEAITYYEEAAEQHLVAAEYNLGLLFLKRGDAQSRKRGMDYLMHAAFQGNALAQYVLAKVSLEDNATQANPKQSKFNQEQAQSMLMLAASNQYGPAQYALAEQLSREKGADLTVMARNARIHRVLELYKGAVRNGVEAAQLPLAFYKAMTPDLKAQQEAFQVANAFAESGSKDGALLLGLLYDRGLGVAMNKKRAIAWYQLANNNPVHDFIMGTYLSLGENIRKDSARGEALLTQAAHAQFAYAKLNLAIAMHEKSQDFLPQLQAAYDLGNSASGLLLADHYLASDPSATAMEDARKIYTILAEQGDQTAQLKLAYMLDNGLGEKKDSAKAQHWYTLSASQGNPVAQYQLAQFYQLNPIEAPNYTQAKSWYEKAAPRLPAAFTALGFLYETVDENYLLAHKQYAAAVLKEDARGQYNLGLVYEYGKGIPVDYAKARALYTMAAQGGSTEAMIQLAHLYTKGLGGPVDRAQADQWLKKAASLQSNNAENLHPSNTN